jgi:hypothetical protein
MVRRLAVASLGIHISYLSILAAACLYAVIAIERRKAKNYCPHGRRLGHYCEPCTDVLLCLLESKPKRVVWELGDL